LYTPPGSVFISALDCAEDNILRLARHQFTPEAV
jgi:hypothetical protein